MGTFCTSGAVIIKAGADVSPDLNAEYENYFIPQAESYINCLCRYNYTDTYSSLNADVKKLLEQVCSDLAAIYAIEYDMSGYESRMMALDMINILQTRANEGLKLLSDDKTRGFINNA